MAQFFSETIENRKKLMADSDSVQKNGALQESF